MKSIFKASYLAALVIACVFLTASAQAQSWITNGLVAYYPFNGNANDAAGTNNGTVNGAVLATDRFGQPSAALRFNSTSGNYVSTTFLPPTGTNSRTFSVWFNSTNNNQEKVILSYGAFNTYPGDRIELKVLSDGSVALGSSYLGIQTLSSWGDGKWHQFGVVIPTNGAVAAVQLFVDGKPQTLVYYNPSEATVLNTATNTALEIGDLQYTGQGFFNGILDDIRIYNRALSSNEVAQLYAIESTPPAGFETNGLVAYYPFNETGSDVVGNNSMIMSNTVFGVDRLGIANKALSFDGNISRWCRSTNVVDASVVNNFTMTIWIKPSGFIDTNNAINGGTGDIVIAATHGDWVYGTGNAGVGLLAGTNGIIAYEHSDNYGRAIYYMKPVSKWTQVSITYSNKVPSLYVDGFLVATNTANPSYNYHPSSGFSITGYNFGIYGGMGIAAWFNGNTLQWDMNYPYIGSMDEYRIYNRALSTNEVAKLYAIESTPPPVGMALIPAGAFTMGDTLDGEADALPVTNVYISAFYMDTNVVSYSQWTNVYSWATNHGYSFDNAGAGKAANHPVQTINWYDSVKWCNARSEMESRTPAYYTNAGLTAVYRTGQLSPSVDWTNGYRLPTEAEWEKAARGRLSQNRFPWGNTISESQANYIGGAGSYGSDAYDFGPSGFNTNYSIGGYPYTSPVGSFAANGYGLFDMAGNIAQWCWDWYGTPYIGGTNPRGPVSGSVRVVRCSAWGADAWASRVAFRFSDYAPSRITDAIGFRSILPLLQSSTPLPPPPIPASITNQPQDVYAVGLSSSYFSVGAAGTAPLAYQWRFNGTNIAGATNSSLTIGVTVSANIGSYTVVVTNGSGSVTSSVAKLYMYPYIYSDPSSLTVSGMGSATFSVGAIGSSPLRYQWKYYGANIAGATNASYTINNVTPSQLGNYYATVSNALGVATSATATLTMSPYLAVPFSGASTNYGDSTTLGVTAWGTGPLTYQWYQNGQPVAGATNQSLPLNNINFNNGGGYTVVVSSSYGSVTNPLQQVVVLPTQPYAPVTLSLTLLKQGSSTVSGGVSTTAAPTQIKLASKDVLAMLAMDEYLKGNWPSNSFPRTATLALVDDTFFVVNGTNALLNVMDIMTLEYGDPQVTSGSRNVATGLASTTAGINRLANIVFNDTAINGGYKLHLYLYGVFSTAVTDTVPSGGVYTETLKVNTATLVGDGYSQNVPVTCTGTISATGKGTLKL